MTEASQNGFEKAVKYWDSYPIPITLRYNKARAYPTVPGGFASIIANCMITYWLVTTLLETFTAGYDHSTIIVLDPNVGKNTTRSTDLLRS